MIKPFPKSLRLFATCPPSPHDAGPAYLARVRELARWCDAAGFEGTLVYTDNGLVDPWLLAQEIMQVTERLVPLIAVQPAYLHPYAAAKLVASLAALYGRRVHLNLVAGGFVKDLVAVGDITPHDRRYDRLVEFGRIVGDLVRGESPVSASGEFYRTQHLGLVPAVSAALQPELFVSGSSPAGLAAARALGALAVEYPAPATSYPAATAESESRRGIRVGIITRPDGDEAWRIARARFPESRKGQLTHQLAMKVSDSAWHHQLSAVADEVRGRPSPYWLVPFENYQTFCPYLVGDLDEVATVLRGYLGAGIGTFILDVPAHPEDLPHTAAAFTRALERQTA